MAILGYITLTLEAIPEGRSYVSRCPELGVTSCGDSMGEAIESVKDAVATYLSALTKLGERTRVFKEKGIEIRKSRPRTIRLIADNLPPNSFAGKVVLSVA